MQSLGHHRDRSFSVREYAMRCLPGLVVALMLVSTSFAATATMTEQFNAAVKRGQHTYVMFYRANDVATQQMANTIKQHVAGTDEKTTWVAVNVSDPKEAQLVKQYNAARIPLPAVFGIAPNGAVAGVFQQRVNAAQLSGAILTPKYSEMVKALQTQKIAVVSLVPAPNTPPPAGVTALMQSPNFKGILHPVTACATDANEVNFFARMQVNRNIQSPVVMVFAPPGTHIGTFAGTATAPQIAQKLHQSGKCNCSKCQKRR